jgi:hypothetical protein
MTETDLKDNAALIALRELLRQADKARSREEWTDCVGRSPSNAWAIAERFMQERNK